MSYYQFITKYRNKFNSDKTVLEDKKGTIENLKMEIAAESTPIATVIEALLTQKTVSTFKNT